MIEASMPPDAPAARAAERLLDSAGVSIDRLPMLHVVFDRMATALADNLRQMSASPAYFSVGTLESARIGDVLESYESRAIAAIFHAVEWDTRILVGLDRAFVYAMIEALFGADGAEPPVHDERPFSNIETAMATAIFERLVKVLEVTFDTVAETGFRFERVETSMDYAVIGRRNNQAVVAKLMLEALGRGGEMFIVIPQSALSPVKRSLAHANASEVAPRDARWSKQIQSEVQRTEVSLRAILEERQMTLEEVAALRVGQVVELQATPRSRVKLECQNQVLFYCELGQVDGSYTLKIDDPIDPEQDFLDDLLAR
jgi:flagellar motor switch protein FliM